MMDLVKKRRSRDAAIWYIYRVKAEVNIRYLKGLQVGQVRVYLNNIAIYNVLIYRYILLYCIYCYTAPLNCSK